MSTNAFVGQIILFPFGFAPAGFALCNGQIIPLAQNTALFSLLGTTFGGNGQTTFAVPDLRGRVPLGPGHAPGLDTYSPGQFDGSETHALTTNQIPAHQHGVTIGTLAGRMRASSGAANQTTPVGNVPATEAAGLTATYSSAGPDSSMQAGSIALTGSMTAAAAGSGQSHANMQPYLAMNYCIALTGDFPAHG